MRTVFLGWMAIAGLTVALLGCNRGPARVAVPDFDADEIGAQALSFYDANHDGHIDAKECSKSLVSGMRRTDKDHDDQLTAEEIAGRLRYYKEYKAGIVPVFCTVSRGGRPVAGATVTYQPEEFMGENALPASGTTDAGGNAVISVSSEHLPSPNHAGVQPGFYRVLVSMAGGASAAKSDLGVECAGDVQNTHAFALP